MPVTKGQYAIELTTIRVGSGKPEVVRQSRLMTESEAIRRAYNINEKYSMKDDSKTTTHCVVDDIITRYAKVVCVKKSRVIPAKKKDKKNTILASKKDLKPKKKEPIDRNIKCHNCGESFEAYPLRKFCTSECCTEHHRRISRQKRNQKKHIRKCEYCDSIFTTNSPKKMYCSNECSYTSSRIAYAEEYRCILGNDSKSIKKFVLDVVFDETDRKHFRAHYNALKRDMEPSDIAQRAYDRFFIICKRLKKTGFATVQMSFNFNSYGDVLDQMTGPQVNHLLSYIKKIQSNIEVIFTEREIASWNIYNNLKSKISNIVCRNKYDLDLVWNECEGRCIYTGIPLVRMKRGHGIHTADCEHIDASIKDTDDDGPQNWVLASNKVNSSKNDSCLYEWHRKNKTRLNLRPINDILEDFKRLGKTIPKPRCSR